MVLLINYRVVFKSGVIQIFETNQSVVILKTLADFICDSFLHLKSQRHIYLVIHFNNVMVSAFALHYCLH